MSVLGDVVPMSSMIEKELIPCYGAIDNSVSRILTKREAEIAASYDVTAKLKFRFGENTVDASLRIKAVGSFF